MRFPSVKNLADSLINTVKRFPFECLFALTGTIYKKTPEVFKASGV